MGTACSASTQVPNHHTTPDLQMLSTINPVHRGHHESRQGLDGRHKKTPGAPISMPSIRSTPVQPFQQAASCASTSGRKQATHPLSGPTESKCSEGSRVLDEEAHGVTFVEIIEGSGPSGFVPDNFASQSSSLVSIKKTCAMYGPPTYGLEYSLRSDMSELVLER